MLVNFLVACMLIDGPLVEKAPFQFSELAPKQACGERSCSSGPLFRIGGSASQTEDAETAQEPASNERAAELIEQWAAENEDVTAVMGSISVIRYDLVFGTESRGKGRFGYRDPQQGFWVQRPLKPMPAKNHRRTKDGKPYEMKNFSPRHWRWQGDRLLDIDDQKKTYEELSLPLKGWQAPLNSPLAHPLFPGLPDKSVRKEFSYQLLEERETQFWLKAMPKPESEYQNQCSAYDLLLEKDDLRLKAIRQTDPAGNLQTVIVFKEITFNPDGWKKPDLSEYTKKGTPTATDQPAKNHSDRSQDAHKNKDGSMLRTILQVLYLLL